ncbi:MAG: amidohydrolase family protein, partial [Smithellaceae bacterium]|nr:amidohydrolase family protein [Smithellaceae bacterium]
KSVRLEEAVYKMTGATAARYRVKDRGYVKEGLAADITVFDPRLIRDNNTLTKTNMAPAGIEAVFINGRQVQDKGRVMGSTDAGVIVL